MQIRKVTPHDIGIWAEMRSALFPDYNASHKPELEKYFAGISPYLAQAYLAEIDGVVAGFIELNLRNFAEGSHQSVVPYVEAWFVQPEYRDQGVGSMLISQAERWAVEQGFAELASDAYTTNARSVDRHLHLGFKETARVVCFLKKLQHLPIDNTTKQPDG